MKSPLRILHLEDDDLDTELLRAMLQMDKIIADVERVETREQYIRALKAGGYDVIISDYSLPSFDGQSALELAREFQPAMPFILFSGTIGEEAAVESLRNGATDYILKQRPERLVASLRRALRESEDRRRRQEAEEALREREEFFRLISENVTDLIAVVNRKSFSGPMPSRRSTPKTASAFGASSVKPSPRESASGPNSASCSRTAASATSNRRGV